jgi:hypothetical protein
MKYPNEEYRARYGSALHAAQNLATLLCLELKAEPALLPPVLRTGLNAPAGNLILVPYASLEHRPQFINAVRETRSTVLIIEPGQTMSGSVTYYITLLLCRRGEVLTYPALQLWVDLEKNAYLIPDAYGEDPEGECFALHARGVDLVPPPFAHQVDRSMGLGHANALLLKR